MARPTKRGIKARVKLSEVGRTLLEIPGHGFTILRSAIIGIWTGIPSACPTEASFPTAASFRSYGVVRRSSPDTTMFGKGDPQGIVAAVIVAVIFSGACEGGNSVSDIWLALALILLFWLALTWIIGLLRKQKCVAGADFDEKPAARNLPLQTLMRRYRRRDA